MEDRGLTLQRLGKSADGREREGDFYGTEKDFLIMVALRERSEK